MVVLHALKEANSYYTEYVEFGVIDLKGNTFKIVNINISLIIYCTWLFVCIHLGVFP